MGQLRPDPHSAHARASRTPGRQGGRPDLVCEGQNRRNYGRCVGYCSCAWDMSIISISTSTPILFIFVKCNGFGTPHGTLLSATIFVSTQVSAVISGMECNRPEQVSFAPGKLRARAPILCPRLGCTYLKQTPLCDMISQNIFVLWPAPEAFFSFFRALRRTRQTATNECISSCKSTRTCNWISYGSYGLGVLEPARPTA